MFADFLKRLTQTQPDQLDDLDAQLALTALLVRIGRSDGGYAAMEIGQINRVLKERFHLSEAEITDLRVRAETLEAEAPDTVRFTRAVKDSVPYKDRTAIIEACWAVVLADGYRDAEEDANVRMVASFLGIKDVDSARARQSVEKRIRS